MSQIIHFPPSPSRDSARVRSLPAPVRDTIRNDMGSLAPMELRVLTMRAGFGTKSHSAEEISRLTGIPVEEVRAHEAKGIARLCERAARRAFDLWDALLTDAGA